MTTLGRIRPVTRARGNGTRLWPVSRAGFRKQFTRLTGDETLFQAAALDRALSGAARSADRLAPVLPPVADPRLTGALHEFIFRGRP